MREISFTGIDGIQVGHEQDLRAATGCTVVIAREGAVAGVDVRGGAPGTRETDLLNPVNLVEKVHAVFLAGGSAFGLAAGTGVMRFLEEKGVGFDVQVARVPIVCGAVLFDLAVGDPRGRPDMDMGYRACRNASAGECGQGSVGAGAGASVGKVLGMGRAMKSGLGYHAVQIGELRVGALVAVNSLGDVVDPLTGERIAGVLGEDGGVLDSEEIMIDQSAGMKNRFVSNTTIGVVATNAALTKPQASKVASMAHNGYARTLRPAHSMFDGDTIFSLATGKVEADVNVVGLLAARVMERAVVAAVKKATPLCGLKSWSDMRRGRINE